MNRVINLYRSELLPPPPKFPLSAMLKVIVGVVLFLAILGAWDYNQLSKLQRSAQSAEVEKRLAQAELDEVKAKSAKTEIDPALKTKVEQTEAELHRRQSLLQMLGHDQSGRAPGFGKFLDGFSRQTVPGLWFRQIRIDNGKDLSLVGCALTPQLLPEFIKKLSGDEAFAEQHFQVFRMTRLDEQDMADAVSREQSRQAQRATTDTRSSCVVAAGIGSVLDFELRSLTELPQNKPLVGGK